MSDNKESEMTIRQRFVKDFACAFLSNSGYIDYIGRRSVKEGTTDDKMIAALALTYADACIELERKTRRQEDKE